MAESPTATHDRGPDARDREHTLGRLVLLALPLLLIALNGNWIMSIAGAIDSWLYYGYFTNLQQFLQAFADTYYGSRLAWILPGALVHTLFPPMAANYVLHLGVYYAALFAIYVTLRRVVGTRAALVTAVLVGSHSYFLAAVGWDYADGAGLAYYAVALACLTVAIDSRRRRVWLAGAGAAFAGSIHTNVVWAIMLPALAYYYLVTPRESRSGRVPTDWALALLGSTALTLALGTAAVANGGSFWFFMPSVAFALSHSPGPAEVSSLDLWTWVARSRSLVLPAAVLVSTVYVRAAHARDAPLVRLLAEHHVLACAALVAFEVASGPVLTLPYYTSYLIPGMALAVGVLLHEAVRGSNPRQYAVTLGIAVMASTVPLVEPVAALQAAAFGHRLPAILVGSFLVVVLAGALARQWASVSTLALLIICAGIVNAVTPNARVWPEDAGPGRRDSYVATVAASEALTALDPEASARFWYDEQAPLGRVFVSIAGTRLWGYRLVGDRFPSLAHPLTHEDASIAPGDRIVVLSAADDSLPQARAALQAAGLDSAVVARRDIATGDVRFRLLLLRASIDPAWLDPTPLPVSSDVFREGSSRGSVERVAVDAADDLVRIVTSRSTADWQVVSRPIALGASRRYLAEFEVDIPRGGAGFRVVSTRTPAVLATRSWCHPLRQASRQQITFDTGTDDSIRLVLSSCGTGAVASDVSVRHLRLRAYRARE
jgi:hypothetical protein